MDHRFQSNCNCRAKTGFSGTNDAKNSRLPYKWTKFDLVYKTFLSWNPVSLSMDAKARKVIPPVAVIYCKKCMTSRENCGDALQIKGICIFRYSWAGYTKRSCGHRPQSRRITFVSKRDKSLPNCNTIKLQHCFGRFVLENEIY